MRIGFLGTPKLSARYLQALCDSHDVIGVVTKPDRPRGRGREPQPPAVKRVAQSEDVPVHQPQSGECGEACDRLREQEPDVCVVVAYGEILPCRDQRQLIDPVPFINVHYSLLPRLRGPAPVHHAILRGLQQTGVTIQYVAEELDTGDIIARRKTDIGPDDTTYSLTVRLTDIGIPLLLDVLEPVVAETVDTTPQDDSQATYAPALEKSDGEIEFSEPAELIERKVRAFTPWPSAYTQLAGKRTKILEAAVETETEESKYEPGTIARIDPDTGFAVMCGVGLLWVRKLQPAGKKPMGADAFLRGATLEIGDRIG